MIHRQRPKRRTDRQDRELLETRLCDLRLDMAASLFAAHMATLGRELRNAGLALRPNFYLDTGYGCVVRTAGG